MIETLLTTVLSSALILKNPSVSPTPQHLQISNTRVLPEKNYVTYVVGKNENLADVSQKYYGSVDYWTNIWNDNPWITDPDNVEGKTISINMLKTSKPEALTSDFKKKQDELNQAYLASIGYETTTVSNESIVLPSNQPSPEKDTRESVSPTAVQPTTQTATPVVTQAPTVAANTSAISDEAITYLGNCEAGMNPTKNTGNGYYGAFQFSAGTWNSMNTGYARADLAPIEVQKAAVKQLIQRSSVYSQFPTCANKMRSNGLL